MTNIVCHCLLAHQLYKTVYTQQDTLYSQWIIHWKIFIVRVYVVHMPCTLPTRREFCELVPSWGVCWRKGLETCSVWWRSLVSSQWWSWLSE